MLAITRLTELAARRPEQLSGGQRQRVALARALVNLPRALLLDEPLSALDRGLRQAMQAELKRIQREVGIAFVFVTHDQEEALGLSDRIAVLRSGRIEQVDTPEAVYDAPATVFVARFIGAANLLPAVVDAVRDGHAIVRVGGGVPAEVAAARAVAAGAAAVVVLRPERVRLSAAAPEPRGAALPVTVTDLTFQGAALRVSLRDAAGLDLVAEVPAANPPPGLARGATLWASWDQQAARVLAADVTE
jgi:spermidine/putrescine transport system ATP-binding protein